MDPVFIDPATGTPLYTKCVFRLGERPRLRKNGVQDCDQHGYRKAFREKYGRMPRPGYCVDHLCNKPQCSNPEHLEEVTFSENHLRGARRGTKATAGPGRYGNNFAYAAFADHMSGKMSLEDIFNYYGIPAPTMSNWKIGRYRPSLLRRWLTEQTA